MRSTTGIETPGHSKNVCRLSPGRCSHSPSDCRAARETRRLSLAPAHSRRLLVPAVARSPSGQYASPTPVPLWAPTYLARRERQRMPPACWQPLGGNSSLLHPGVQRLAGAPERVEELEEVVSQ